MKLKCIFFYYCLLLFSCSYSSSDYMDDLGDGYLFVSESNSNQFISGPNDTTGKGLIPCTVEAFAFNDNHIIAKQKNNPDCSNETISDILEYWIIDKKKKIVYGPIDSVNFDNKRNELKVSYSLRFKDR